ncbi:MAG: CocE/NonD family hydrolase, partial [Candidatus Methylomirabilis sp.]|nr:CocE/NonD family hydrolase [Deltaproteobacteria bacterium]
MARRENSSDLLRRAARKLETEPGDAHWSGPYRPGRALRRGAVRRSLYLTMRDGVRIAVDLHLPGDLRAGEKVPTILRQTRYGRSVEPRALWKRLRAERLFDVYARTRARFLAHGYAWVDADVRGSGASFGRYRHPWTPEEIADGAVRPGLARDPVRDLAAVGATGISYDGNAAEFLLANAHPAVRAVAPRACHFDTYADVAFPGGLHQKWFTEAWGLATA